MVFVENDVSYSHVIFSFDLYFCFHKVMTKMHPTLKNLVLGYNSYCYEGKKSNHFEGVMNEIVC